MTSSFSARSRVVRAFTVLVALMVVAVWVGASAGQAQAAVACDELNPPLGEPPILLTKEMPAEQLYATPIPVTLHATQQAAPPPESGFNLSFRDVLPANVSYVPGSSNPAPQIINDQPALGMTTLIWTNVADLAPGADYSLTYEVAYDETVFDAGDTIETGTLTPEPAAGAYVNCNPRWIPLFDGAGQPTGTEANSASSSATAAPQQTLLKAIEIEKSEPSSESELLRGVHNNQTPYTLTVRNNTQRPTDNLVVVDYLPAGLEFLGCGTTDNTTNVAYNGGSDEEYPGSGPINPGNEPVMPDCIEPDSVAFGSWDPDGAGSAPVGLYTRVEWNLGSTLVASEVFELQYAAAIPVCPNTTSWTQPAVGPTGETANLNNNNCAGGETVDETSLQNFATASGDYHQLDNDVVAVSDTDDHVVSAEDLAIEKSVAPSQYEVGATVRWTLLIRTSEYRTFEEVVVEDTVPNGMCPVVGDDPPYPSPTPPSQECEATGNSADNPSLIWDSATENLDGTWTMLWSLPPIPADDTSTISFSTQAREFYRDEGLDTTPVLATDPLTNEVDISGEGYPICTNGVDTVVPCSDPGAAYIAHTESPGTLIEDHSEATVNSGVPELDKKVATPASVGDPASCPAPASPGYIDGTASFYRTGDLVCWKLRVDFPNGVTTGGVTVTDFLPEGASYVTGVPGTGQTGNNTVGISTVDDNGSFVDFVLTGQDVSDGGQVFEYIIATRMLNLVDDPSVVLPPIRGNLLKMTSVNTAGDVTTYRDQANSELEAPALAITKGVKSIDGAPVGGNGPDVDGGTVVGGQPVVYRVDVSNSSLVDAVNSTVVERMVGPYDCTMVSAISPGGSCATTGSGATALTEITWTGIDVDASDSEELNFTMTYPDTIAPGVQIDDNACVKDYQNETNDTSNPTYTWVLDNPVATCGALSTVPPTNGQLLEGEELHDPSFVTTPGSISKSVTTSVTASNNSLNTQATIGETITYSVTATIPGHTTVKNFTISDLIAAPTRQVYVPGSATCVSTIVGFCLATTVTYGTPANTVVLTAGGGFVNYTNSSSSDETITLQFQTQVADVGGNVHNATLTNRGTVGYEDQYDVDRSAQTNQTTIRVVEPNPQISKSNDDADDVVSPGQEIEYTLTVTNPNRPSGPASPALYDSQVVDVVPAHLTPTDGMGLPLPDGFQVATCAGVPTGGIWNSTLRTITWSVGTVLFTDTVDLRYCVEVNEAPAPPASVPLTNEVTLTGTSMNGAVPGERTYTVETDDTVVVAGSQLDKTANKTTATIGESVDYTVQVVLPANTEFYTYVIEDQLATGTAWVTSLSADCTPAIHCGSTPSPSISGSGVNRSWNYGTIPAAAGDRTLTLSYRVIIEDVVANAAGDTLTNSASNQWCLVNDDPCDVDDLITPPGDSADVDIVEPELTIDKDVDCQTGDTDTCEIQPGDSFTYSITVTNDGSSTAFDAVFSDTPPSQLTNIVVGALPTTTSPGGDPVVVSQPVPSTYEWTIDELAPGESITITYTADLVSSANLNDPFTVTNTASVTEYWGLDDADRASNPEAREYPGVDPTDTVTLDGHLPDPQVVKTVENSGNAELNQCLTWSLTISNESLYADLYNIDVVDTLPNGWEYCSGTTTLQFPPAVPSPHSDPSISGQDLSWSNVGNRVGGSSDMVLHFQARPTMAALDVDGEPTNPYTNSVTITGEDASGATESDDGPYSDGDTEDANIQMPQLTIEKTPNDETVIAGEWNDWTIVVTNNGTGTARDVEIRDAVPAGLSWDLDAHSESLICASPVTCSTITPPANETGTGPADLTWTLDSLAPGQSVTLTLPMLVPASDDDGTSYENNAGVLSTERPDEITDDGNWTTEREADMQIVKTDGGAAGVAGENVTYTLTATNNGPSNASNVAVQDAIDTDDFVFVSITPVNPNDTCNVIGSDPVTDFECLIDGEMEPGDNAVFTLVLQIKPGVTTTVSNTATVTSEEPDPDTDNNTSTDTTLLGTNADLAITKTLSQDAPGSIPNHSETSFTLEVSNLGPSDALNVVVTDDLPDGLSCVSTTPTADSGCDGNSGETVTWNLGTIEAGDSVTLTIVVRGEEVGDDWENLAEVDSDTPDSDPNNNEDTEEVDVTPMADLEIEKTGDATVASGQNFTYTLQVRNNGPDEAVTPTVTDTLPTGLTFVSYTADDPEVSCSASGQTITCNLPSIDGFESPTFNIDIVVNSGFDLSETCVDNVASVISTTTDSEPGNNTSDVETCVGPNADVAIVKSGPAWGASGHPMQYTLSVINNGPATSENVIVLDPLPAGLTYVSATPTVGSCNESVPNEVECALGDMAPGATAQIVVVATPDNSVVGTTIVNTATVITDTPDGDPDNNESTVETPIENNQYPTSSNVSLTKTVSSSAPKVGDLISYTMVATNHGPSTAIAATVTDTIPTGLIYNSVSGDGTCTFTEPQLSCQLGDVPVGQSRTITVTAYVAKTGEIVNSAVAGASNDRDPTDNTAVSPTHAARSTARLSITKKSSKKTVKVGGKVGFTIKVKNTSRVNAVNVTVCDLIPARMSVVRRAGGYLKSGNLCWDVPVLRAGKSRTFKPVFRVSNGRASSVTNPVRAKGTNTNTARAKAKVKVPLRQARAGGTTG